MAKPKLAVLSIHPAKNGGHRVVHEFERKPVVKSSLLSLEGPPTEEHSFGPGENSNLLSHIKSALALKGMSGSGEEEAG